MATNDVIIIIKTPSGGGPIEQVANVETSLIEYMCNNCNKKYPTRAQLKDHFRFCSESENGISDVRFGKVDDTRNNNLSTKDLNFENAAQTKSNPYEFEEDDDNDDDSVNFDDNDDIVASGLSPIIKNNNGICECCGEDVRTAHQPKELSCKHCNKYYKHEKSLDAHTKRFHSTLKSAINCSQCDARCVDEIALREHTQTHNPTKVIACNACGKDFTRKYHLERHLKQTGCDGRKKSSFSCRVCGNVFARKDNLREHLRHHVNNGVYKKMYICDFCNKNFKGRGSLITHIRTHTGESPFICSFCNKANKTKAALIKHERIHTGEKPFSCKECGKAFAAKEILNRHVKTHLEIKPIACLECGKTFIQSSQLRNHMFYHTGKNNLKCKYCDKTFNKKSRLIIHEKYDHEGAKKMICSFDDCTKSFLTKENLKKHEMTHTDEKPFKCKVCDKYFRTKAQKCAHELTHRREAPRSCFHCPRAFIRADCFLRHMRTKHLDDYKALIAITRKNKLESMKEKLKNYKSEFVTTSKHSDNSSTNGSLVSNDDLCFSFDKIKENRQFSDSLLISNIEALISLLVDKESLDEFGWPNVPVDKVLEEVIRKCGEEPVNSNLSRVDKLRQNTKILFTVAIDDATMKKLVDLYTIDDVISHVLQLGKST